MKLLDVGQLKGLQEAYTKVQTHLAEASSDPPNLPYRSKYMALEELARMRDLVTELGEGEHQSAITSFLLTKVEKVHLDLCNYNCCRHYYCKVTL